MARLFSALVSIWAEDGRNHEERAALEWLEAQDPPFIAASKAVRRKAVTYFVPISDVSIMGLPFYEKKAKEVWAIQDSLDQEMAASGGRETANIAKLRQNLSNARDVAAQTGRAGKTNPGVAARLFPEKRDKQARFFPSVTPDEPRVTYVWNATPPDGLDKIIDGLLYRVSRLGHSSSLVSCRVTREPILTNFFPGSIGDNARSIRRGQLATLERLYDAHRGIRPRSLPYENVQYSPLRDGAESAGVQSSKMSGDWIVFEFTSKSRQFPSTRTVELARAMRSAIMRYATDPIPEGISGHRSGGEPTTVPHIAFIPLPYVGYAHSDGRLLGVAMSLPGLLDDSARRAALRAVGFWERKENNDLELGLPHHSIGMSRKPQPDTKSLQYGVWSRPSSQWVTATPIALPKHPGRLGGGDVTSRAKAWAEAESSVADACIHVGLSRPLVVKVSLSPFLAGAHHVGRFPPFVQTGSGGKKIRRQLVHALVTFDGPVKGPLALGAGRFMGLGLMRPVSAGEPQGVGVAP